jgi:surfactin synthase thioesterase subunit
VETIHELSGDPKGFAEPGNKQSLAMNVNLICLPFAGGNKYSYRVLESKMPSFLNAVTLEYPGRGSRIAEPLLTDAYPLAEDSFRQLKKIITRGPYALYGHSMGGLLACLVTRKIVESGLQLPLHVFISGTSGPAAPSREKKKRHLLEKDAFIEEIRTLNGSPAELLEDTELLEYFEPILRADFKASESFVYRPAAPVEVPFTVITGTEEDMTLEDIGLWQKESRIDVDYFRMPGGHFFIFDSAADILEIVTRKIQTIKTEKI